MLELEPDRPLMMYTAIALAPPQVSALLPGHRTLQLPYAAGVADEARVFPQTQKPANDQRHLLNGFVDSPLCTPKYA